MDGEGGGPTARHLLEPVDVADAIAPYEGGTGDDGSWDARTALQGMTKRVMVSHDPAQAVQHTQLAVKHATAIARAESPVVVAGNGVRVVIDVPTSLKTSFKDVVQPLASNGWKAGD